MRFITIRNLYLVLYSMTPNFNIIFLFFRYNVLTYEFMILGQVFWLNNDPVKSQCERRITYTILFSLLESLGMYKIFLGKVKQIFKHHQWNNIQYNNPSGTEILIYNCIYSFIFMFCKAFLESWQPIVVVLNCRCANDHLYINHTIFVG